MTRLRIKITNTLDLIVICSILFIGLMTFGTGCGDEGDTTNTGTLSLYLSDAPASVDYTGGVWVTVDEVLAHKGEEGSDEEIDEELADWVEVAAPYRTYNLLELTNCNWVELGLTTLGIGHYTQMRLYLGDEPDDPIIHPYANYVIDKDGNELELTVPSGYETGIKLIKGFDIGEGVLTKLLLDFDASESITVAGNSDKLLLKPTIKVIDVEYMPILSGIITGPINGTSTNGPLSQVYISAQVYDQASGEVTVSAGTMSNDFGEYCMTLENGSYNIVAYKEGFMPYCDNIDILQGIYTYNRDMTLNNASGMVNVYGSISLPYSSKLVDEEDIYAAISFRKTGDCPDDSAEIEVLSMNISDAGEVDGDFDGTFDGTFAVDLPALPGGEYYKIIVSSIGFDTREASSEIMPVIIE